MLLRRVAPRRRAVDLEHSKFCVEGTRCSAIHRHVAREQHVCKEEEEEVLCEQQLCIQERSFSLDQEPLQIKEEQEELCTCQEEEHLELKQETETFMLTPTHEERGHMYSTVSEELTGTNSEAQQDTEL
ncbi:hypothetical protein EYF80_045171 [Liparis tanakae]|uniref:Uncharacterized protein n=1 Tax=Liparis tanakae TaxID=230148 RepID=A0A4Z2FTU9_9TELE|nr:hypothetical protein EYF80_045171 [Liparis tanakae]